MRRVFGSIIQRKDRDGNAVSLLARYINPLDPSKRVTQSFPLDAKAQAQTWLDNEEALVAEHNLGTTTWTSPKERAAAEQRAEITFRDYAQEFLDGYRTKDGAKLEESTKRKKRESINYLTAYFGDKLVSDITSEDVKTWLYGDFVNGPHPLKRAYQVLKAIMKKAMTSENGSAPLIETNPCIFPNPKLPKSQQALIPPATVDEIKTIYDSMPDYTRISVHIGAVFGLRISEICALQVSDVDLKHKLLHIRHALKRNEGDKGELQLKATKTEMSEEDMTIPDDFIPELRRHIAEYCDEGEGAMLLRPKNKSIMSTGTLRSQFETAREEAGRPDLHFHTLRATGITAAVTSGGTPKEVQNFGRHADPEISLALYQRASKEGEEKLADKVFESLVKPERTLEVAIAERRDVVREITKLRRKRRELEAEILELRKNSDTPFSAKE